MWKMCVNRMERIESESKKNAHMSVEKMVQLKKLLLHRAMGKPNGMEEHENSLWIVRQSQQLVICRNLDNLEKINSRTNLAWK
jgi:hypothetical protein